MKLKFPKEITILSNRFKMLYDKTTNGGSFNFADGEMIIGTKCLKDDPQHVFQVISHEVMESIYCVMGARYESAREHKHYLFSFDHMKFETANQIYCDTIINFIA